MADSPLPIKPPRLALIVEDDHAMALLEEHWFKTAFPTDPTPATMTVPTLAEAIAILRDLTIPIDLLILNLLLPDSSAPLETLHAIVTHTASRLIPIVLVTTMPDAEIHRMFIGTMPQVLLSKETLTQDLFHMQVTAVWEHFQALRQALNTIQTLGAPLPEQGPEVNA